MQQLIIRNLFRQLQAYSWIWSILFFGCTPVKYSDTTPTQPKAKYYSFSKLSTPLTNGMIDTSLIYVYESDLVKTYRTGKVEKFYGYVYLVFKANGIAYYSSYSDQPFNQTNIYSTGGQYCFYKVEDDELQLEFYDFHLKRFTISYGKIFDNKIYFFEDKLRMFNGAKSKRNMIFAKSSIKYSKPLIWPE